MSCCGMFSGCWRFSEACSCGPGMIEKEEQERVQKNLFCPPVSSKRLRLKSIFVCACSMNSLATCGNGRPHDIESPSIPIRRFRGRPAPWARLGTAGTPGAEETPGRSLLAGRAQPAPSRLLAADPASIDSRGLRVPLQEHLPRIAAAGAPPAPRGGPFLSFFLWRGGFWFYFG